jgi:hypothetical protein
VPDDVFQVAAIWLGGLVQTMAVYIVEPAVEGAAEPAILDPPVGQRGQPVGTVQADQAGASRIVAESPDLRPAPVPGAVYYPA